MLLKKKTIECKLNCFYLVGAGYSVWVSHKKENREEILKMDFCITTLSMIIVITMGQDPVSINKMTTLINVCLPDHVLI